MYLIGIYLWRSITNMRVVGDAIIKYWQIITAAIMLLSVVFYYRGQIINATNGLCELVPKVFALQEKDIKQDSRIDKLEIRYENIDKKLDDIYGEVKLLRKYK